MTFSRLLPNPWPGLLPNGTNPNVLKKVFTVELDQPKTFCAMSPTQRIRYCLRGPQGYATENGFTMDPGEAIQLSSQEAAAQRILTSGRIDLLPHPVTFEKHDERWVAVTF